MGRDGRDGPGAARWSSRSDFAGVLGALRPGAACAPWPIACCASPGSRPNAPRTPRKEQDLDQVETLEETIEKSNPSEPDAEEPAVVEDICLEELAIDGICGVY